MPPITTMANGCCDSRTDPRRNGRRQQAKDRGQRSHQHGSQPLLRSTHDCLVERQPIKAESVERRDEQQAIHHRDAEDRDEPDGGRNAEVRVR